MKLKLKLRNPSVSFNIQLEAEKETFKHLKDEISLILSTQIFSLEGSIPFDVSFNGKVAINGTEEATLQSLEIVSGDLLHILIESDVLKNLTPIEKASNQSVTETKEENVEGIEDEKIINRYLNKPMLCRESTEVSIPSSLRREFERNKVETVQDALTVVAHVLMIEAGFILRERSKTSGGIYNLVYHLHHSSFSCKLVCIPMGRILMVNGIVLNGSNGNKVVSMCELDCNRYIVTKPTYKDIDPIHVYKNLAQLSHHFIDSVVYPLQMLSQSGGLTGGLLALPTEVKLLILTFLDVRELVSISSVCSELNQIANEQTLWKKLFCRDFKNIVRTTEIDWKQKYKDGYLERKEMLRRARRPMIIDPDFGFNPMMPLRNPFPWSPQPLFGDHDLYPPIYPGGPMFPQVPRPRIDPVLPGIPDPPLSRNRRPPFPPDRHRDPFGFFQNHMHFI